MFRDGAAEDKHSGPSGSLPRRPASGGWPQVLRLCSLAVSQAWGSARAENGAVQQRPARSGNGRTLHGH